MDIDQIQRVNDLRARMLANKENNLPADDGITREELRDAIAALQTHRTSALDTASKKGRKKKPTLDDLGIDLKAMLKED